MAQLLKDPSHHPQSQKRSFFFIIHSCHFYVYWSNVALVYSSGMNYVSGFIREEKKVTPKSDSSKRKKCSRGGAMGVSSAFVTSYFWRWLVSKRGIIMLFFYTLLYVRNISKMLKEYWAISNPEAGRSFHSIVVTVGNTGWGGSGTISPQIPHFPPLLGFPAALYIKVLHSKRHPREAEHLPLNTWRYVYHCSVWVSYAVNWSKMDWDMIILQHRSCFYLLV